MSDSKLDTALAWKQSLADASELIEAKEYKRAIVLLEDALKMAESLTGPEDLRIAETLERLAFAYHCLGCLQDAEPHYRRAIEVAVPRLFGRDTEISATENLANLLCETDRAAEGEEMREAILKKYPEPSDEDMVQTNVSTSYRMTIENDIMRSLNGVARSNPDLTLPIMNEMLGIIETVFGADSPEVIDALEMLGNSSPTGAEYHDRALRIKIQKSGSTEADEAAIAYTMRALALSQPPPPADRTFSDALLTKARSIEKKLGVTNVLDMTMGALVKQFGKGPERPEMSLEQAEEILAAWQEQKPDVPPFIEMTLTKDQRYKQLLPILEKALTTVCEIEKDEEYPLSTICIMSEASRVHKELGDIETAKALLEKKMKVIANSWGEGHGLMVDAYEAYQALCKESE